MAQTHIDTPNTPLVLTLEWSDQKYCNASCVESEYHWTLACCMQLPGVQKMALSQIGSIIIKGHFFLGHPVSAFLPSICIHDFEDKMKLKLIYKTLDISHKSTP